MWPLTVWNVGWGAWCFFGNQENWEGRSVWVCRVEMQKKHTLGAFSVFFPTTSFFKESNTFQMSEKATDIMEKTDQCYVALVHFVGRFHQPEALLPAWPLVLLMLSTMLAVWKPGGFEHDFSGTSWEGFKDDCDTMKFTRNQIWRTKSIKFSRL